MLKPEFIQIKTSDHFTLPGLLYEPKGKRRGAVVYLHGNGSSSVFYRDDQREEWTAALARQGISLLLFNNRGAHIIKNLHQQKQSKTICTHGGVAYEKIRDCVPDIDGALMFLKKRGYKNFYLAGESTGANKICVYNHYQPRNNIKGYILLSGGDDTGIYYDQLGKKRFQALLKKALLAKQHGRGEEIMKEIFPELIFSNQSFYDIANPAGDYNVFPFYETIHNINLSQKKRFRYFQAIKKPTLVVYGEADEYCWGDVPGAIKILQQLKPEFSYKIIPNADHTFSGHQKQLAKVMARWLTGLAKKI